jgi:hypothetical protein
MNLNEILKQHDPAREAGDADVDALRASIMTSPRRPTTARRAVLACALLIVVIAAVVSLRREPQRPTPIVRKAPIEQRPDMRQLQLTTPGGTQLIWVFNDSM